MEKNETSVLAIIGFALGIMGIMGAFLFAGFYFGIPGIIFSIVALGNVKKKELKGKGLAIAGVITSVISLIASILVIVFTVFLVDTAAETIESKSEMSYDVYTAQSISTAVKMAYYNEIVCEDMSLYEGSTVTFTDDFYASMPESFRREFEAYLAMSDDLKPAYVDNGAKYFAVEFTADGCEAVYVTDGVTFWELYPYTCDEYYGF